MAEVVELEGALDVATQNLGSSSRNFRFTEGCSKSHLQVAEELVATIAVRAESLGIGC
jgi:hypothetical protein